MKVTEELIESRIVGKYFINLGDAVKNTVEFIEPSHLARMQTVTKCVLILENGYTIEGMSACVDPTIFDEAKGQKYAYEDALSKIWPLEGYVLANQMHETEQSKSMLKGFLEDDNCEGGGCKI